MKYSHYTCLNLKLASHSKGYLMALGDHWMIRDSLDSLEGWV